MVVDSETVGVKLKWEIQTGYRELFAHEDSQAVSGVVAKAVV